MSGATLKRDLRTGRSLWADSPGLRVPVRALNEAVVCDVAVVGAGISGAFMAHELSRDHSVIVLDRRPPLTGSTMASTAMLQWEIDLPLTVLSQRIGAEKARRAYRRSFAAVAALKQVVAEEGIRCGRKDKAALYLAGDAYGRRALEAEAEARAALGLDSVFMGPAELRERFGIERTGAILSQGAASADPARLAAGLLRRAATAGARIFSPVEVSQAASDPEGVTLLTDAGHAVRARRVVFCCGYEFPKGVPTPGAEVISTWALASLPRTRCPTWLRDTLVWEGSDPYLFPHGRGRAADRRRRGRGRSHGPRRSSEAEAQVRDHRRQAAPPAAGGRVRDRLRLGWGVWRKRHRPAVHSTGAGHGPRLGGDGVRRQRHHLFRHRQSGGGGGLPRRSGCRRGPVSPRMTRRAS
ncbi:NAD(P)/FAD-dependent oxidoreductase [Brevundimonas sp. NPDC058933]|uniref:NAD(P)/FAD-dependent oxidoreductase n=1 Tax=Brevundimonas sp. NPDC058933 TaxID=3346673 RepID=UPI003BEF086C